MSKKENTIVSGLLAFMYESVKLLPLPFETPYGWVKRQRGMSRGSYRSSIYKLEKRGVLRIVIKNNKKFVKITKKGELEILLAKAVMEIPEVWDGKWRFVFYDIPEDSKDKRQLFRKLLKRNGYQKLQASVFVNPYPLNREALDYLKKTGLINYIRIVRVDEIDDDSNLLKKFNLNRTHKTRPRFMGTVVK